MCRAMAVSGHLLILLVPVLSLCGATEYYVRPTEPTNTSCPAQPCLTLNQYTSDSDHYFKSNTVFKFLPGTHHMDRPVTIGNVQNMSLERLSDESDEYPHLVAQFSCDAEVHECITSPWYWTRYVGYFKVCCAAFWLHDMYSVTVKGISITVQTSNEPSSGIILQNVSGITVQLSTKCSEACQLCTGITIYGSTSVEVHSSSANSCSNGLLFLDATNTLITNVTAMYNGEHGMILSRMGNTHITNTALTQNNNAGMFLSFMDSTYITNVNTTYNDRHGMQSLNMTNTHITNMTSAYNGMNGIFLMNMRNTHITNTVLIHNGFSAMYLLYVDNTHITKTTATHNGNNSFPLSEACCGQILIVFSTRTLIYNTSFSDIYSPGTISNTIPATLPAVIVLHSSAVHVSGCEFTGNNVSSVRALASNITVSGDLTFSSNRAFAGTAFVLVYDSILASTENTHIYFLNNHATNTGGVFYIVKNNMHPLMYLGVLLSRSTCFLNTEGSRFQTRFTFLNNSAEKGGDILYGGEMALILGLDGIQNCLDSFHNISNISQNGLSLISSDPSRVCLCNGTGQPDCLVVIDPTPHTVYPGQTINISAVVVGQAFGTVSGSAYAQFLQRGSLPQLEPGQEAQGVTQHKCGHLCYTFFSRNEVSEAVLILTAHDSYVSEFNDIEYSDLINNLSRYMTDAHLHLAFSKSPVYVKISLLPCPAGFMLTTNTPFRCDCNSLLQQMHGIKCHIQEQTIGRSGLLWVGMIQDDNGTDGTVAASEYCPLDYCNKEENNVTLNESDPQCNYNHSGTLCGGCQPGLSLALGSAQCMQCSNNYLALLIPLTLAGPILVFSIKVLDLTISHGTLNGLIFYANIVKANEYIFLPQGKTNPLTVFIAWLNLDLGVETCLFQGLTAYSKTWLQFVFPFYIWTIAGIIIIIAKYSDRVAKVMGNNSVPVLATLFLLSYAKLLHTIITALTYTMVYTSHGPKAVWTADGNVDYLGPQHAPLFATAVAVLLFLWLPYTLLLFLGQWLHRCNCRLVVHLLMKIKPFLDAHYGPLKGKHRYWFGTLLLVRAAILLISALVPANRSSIIVLCISVFAIMLAYFGQLVYRNLAVAMFDIASFVNLALMTGAYSFTTTVGGKLSVSGYTLIGIAFLQFVGLVCFKVLSILRRSEKANRCLRKGQTTLDDWELYEQAALQREMESDAEEQDSEGSESDVSLPTY